MIFVGLLRLCEQNIVRMFTAANHKQPSSKFSSVSINGSPATGWVDWSASTVQAVSLDWLG